MLDSMININWILGLVNIYIFTIKSQNLRKEKVEKINKEFNNAADNYIIREIPKFTITPKFVIPKSVLLYP